MAPPSMSASHHIARCFMWFDPMRAFCTLQHSNTLVPPPLPPASTGPARLQLQRSRIGRCVRPDCSSKRSNQSDVYSLRRYAHALDRSGQQRDGQGQLSAVPCRAWVWVWGGQLAPVHWSHSGDVCRQSICAACLARLCVCLGQH
jgi:hypothetical protein